MTGAELLSAAGMTNHLKATAKPLYRNDLCTQNMAVPRSFLCFSEEIFGTTNK
jgi:hypothetical protein